MANTDQHLFTGIEIHSAQRTRSQAQTHKDLPDEFTLKILAHGNLLHGIVAIEIFEEDGPVLLVQGLAIVKRDIRISVLISLGDFGIVGESGEYFVKPAGLEWGCAVRGENERGQPESS